MDCEEPLIDRTVDEVRTVIEHAKLDEADLLPLSQVICFSGQLMDMGEDIRLMEVSKDVAADLSQGDTMVMRGEDLDSAVICTNNRTFDLKGAETSNSMLLLPSISYPSDIVAGAEERKLAWRTVTGVGYKFMELQQCRPKLRRLRQLLTAKPYTHTSSKEGHRGFSLDALLERVQASREELRKGLTAIEAVTVDDQWFILDTDYQMKILSYILRFFNESSYKLDCVKKSETVEAIKELVPEGLVSQVFDIYCDKMEGGDEDEHNVNNNKVCRFYGDFLLAPTSGFNLSEFLEMWQGAVPDGLQSSIEQLAGLALVDNSAKPATIRRFTEESLPETIQDRLAELFLARERWTVEEITPFVSELTTAKLNVNALLTKYARPLNVAGVKYFCAKHGK